MQPALPVVVNQGAQADLQALGFGDEFATPAPIARGAYGGWVSWQVDPLMVPCLSFAVAADVTIYSQDSNVRRLGEKRWLANWVLSGQPLAT